MKLRELFASRHEPEAYRALATGYWNVLLVYVAITTCALLIYGGWQFTRPLAPADGGSVVRPQVPLSRVQLQSVLEKLQARAIEFERRRVSPESVRDPS